MEDEFEARRIQILYNKMYEDSVQKNNDVRANPLPHLKRAADEVIKLRKTLEAIRTAAYPPEAGATAEPTLAPDDEAQLRLQKIIDILEADSTKPPA